MDSVAELHAYFRDFDAEHSKCPVARRQRELREQREAERERVRMGREAQRQREERQLAAANNLTTWDEWFVKTLDRTLQKGGALFTHLDEVFTFVREQHRSELKVAFEKLREELKAAIDKLREDFKTATSKLHDELRDELDRRHVVDQERRELERALNKSNIDAGIAGAIETATAKLRGDFDVTANKLCDKLGLKLGRLPMVKSWDENEISYCGDVVTHDGNLYQALRDTAKEPPHRDWIMLARAGRDGLHGCTPRFRDVFNAYERYHHRDIVTCDGSAYIATCDNPGLPGHDEGWKILARGGGRGPAGEVGPRGRKGERGARGEAAPAIISWVLDYKRYTAIPTLSDGKEGAPLELRGLFEQFLIETGGLPLE